MRGYKQAAKQVGKIVSFSISILHMVALEIYVPDAYFINPARARDDANPWWRSDPRA
jgi:hypothetical protein